MAERLSNDQNFKNLILDYPRPALAFFAASEAVGLEVARVVPVRQEQLKERLGNRFRELDTPLLVEWPDGRRELLYFIIEQETEAARFNVLRLMHYTADLAELFDTRRVVPVVVFLDGGPPERVVRIGSESRIYLEFSFLSVALRSEPAVAHLESSNIVARLTLPLMECPAEQRVLVYAQAYEGLASLEPDFDKRRKYSEFIDTYSRLSETELRMYQREYLPRSAQKEKVMGMLAVSRQEGRQDEAQILLGRMVRRRFGESTAVASEPLLAQLRQLGALEDLAEALLDCADEAAWLGRLNAAVAAQGTAAEL
jgi:hypothetical protein